MSPSDNVCKLADISDALEHVWGSHAVHCFNRYNCGAHHVYAKKFGMKAQGRKGKCIETIRPDKWARILEGGRVSSVYQYTIYDDMVCGAAGASRAILLLHVHVTWLLIS